VAKVTKRAAAGEVVRMHETTGSATGSFSASIAAALRGTKAEIPDPTGVEIVKQWADVKAGKLVRYHSTVRIAYRQTLRAVKG